jgi:hypothetical protein
MRRSRVLAFLLSLPLVAASAPATARPRTLARLHDPVVVRTALLGPLSARDTARWRLYAAHDGRLEPIPFQFDARDTDGEVVLSDEDFSFDDDDELVFMAKDAGDQANARGLLAACDIVLEIEVIDEAHPGRGWVYLAHFPDSAPPRSPVRYATFDPERDEARTAFYSIGYSSDRSNFVTGLSVSPRAGGSGERLIRRTSLRIAPTFSLLWTRWSPTYTEESFSVTTEGVRNGPVRAVRRVRQALALGRLLPEVPQGTVSTYYYFSSFLTPSRFSIPGLALRALREFRFASVHDFGPDAVAMRYWDAANPEGVPLAAGAPPGAVDHDHDWWVASGPGGTLLHALVIPERWRLWGVSRGIAVGVDDGRDSARGAGYTLLGIENLREPGDYRIDSTLVVLPGGYRPGDEARALAMLREPLAVEVRPIAIAGE